MNILKTSLIATVVSLTAISAQAGSVTKDGNILIVEGEFDADMWLDWDNLFDPKTITHVKLESPGGSVFYGQDILDDVYENRWTITTEATGLCASMCSATWMAADKHVYNSNAEIGFHLAYIPELDFWRDTKDKWGFNGVEWYHKDGVMEDVITFFTLIDNKHKFGDFLEGLQEEGLMGHDMWYPTDAQLVSFEGAWSETPVYITEKFEPTNKGTDFVLFNGTKTYSQNIWEVNYNIRVIKDYGVDVNAELYDVKGNLLTIGWERDNIVYDTIFSDWYEIGEIYKDRILFTKTRPVWLKVFSDDGDTIKWYRLP